MSGWMVALPLLMVCEGAAMLAAFWLGAWAREPFMVRPRKKAGENPEEKERVRQRDSLFNYSVDDARRAAREGMSRD